MGQERPNVTWEDGIDAADSCRQPKNSRRNRAAKAQGVRGLPQPVLLPALAFQFADLPQMNAGSDTAA